MNEPGGNDSEQQLRSFVRRREALDSEAADIAEAKRGLRKELKDAGFDPKAFNDVIARRRLEPALVEANDALVETYEASLGCGAQSAGVLSATRDADGVFKVQMIAAPDADEKLTKATQARKRAMMEAELSRMARGD